MSYYSPSGESSKTELKFNDGEIVECDVLIGADGIHSVTRRILLELAALDIEADEPRGGRRAADLLRSSADPVWSGHTAYRAVASAERLKKVNPNHRILTTPQIVSLSSPISH